MNTYTVQSGDTLQSIAKDVLGDESLATYLASINQVNTVSPGQVLNVGVAEVSAKYSYTPWIVGGLLLLAGVWWTTK